MVLMRVIPAGLKGVLIMAMLAAMMSTLNTAVNGTGALIVRDFYQNLINQVSEDSEEMIQGSEKVKFGGSNYLFFNTL